MLLGSFLQNRRGSTTVAAGASALLLVAAVGGSIDITRMSNARAELQRAVDAATLAAAKETDEATQEARFDSMMSTFQQTHEKFELDVSGDNISQNDGSFTGTANAKIGLMFGKVILGNQKRTLGARAQAALRPRTVEVSLVVDMSSSMIEDGRFEPARTAVKSFVDKFKNDTGRTENARIALVPFSSRINFGMSRQNFFGTWNSADAIPDRWINPEDHHGDSWTRSNWIDNITPVMTKDTYRRWIGCVEPRLDVSVERGETTFSPTEVSPSDEPFIAQDHNPSPGLTFCPPPIQPLTDSAATLMEAADALSSQGSTRLDAGMAGAWYTLSPEWRDAWGGSHQPALYTDTSTSKIVVFMTDGGMNTIDDPDMYGYDWVCKADGDCDDRAKATLLATCDAMKAKGIEIFSVSYGQYANRTYVKDCATDETHFFTAVTEENDDSFIDTIYRQIADKINEARPLLIH